MWACDPMLSEKDFDCLRDFTKDSNRLGTVPASSAEKTLEAVSGNN